MNDHPEELLADYVEGSLGSDERARVEEHMSGCELCRVDVDLATEARAALASLPELEAPKGIPLGVRRKAKGTPSRTWRLVGTAAAAAVLAAGAIFVFSNVNLGTSDQQADSGTAAESERAEDTTAGKTQGGGGGLAETEASDPQAQLPFTGAPPPVLPIYAESQKEYLPEDLARLARGLREEANSAIRSGIAPTASAFFADFDTSPFTPEVRQAIRCVLADVPPEQLIVPFRIEAATFQGLPAYVATFLQGPTPDDAYDRLVMWVAHRETCGLMSLASQVL